MLKLLRRAVLVGVIAAGVYAWWRLTRTPDLAPLTPHPVSIPPGVELEGGPEVDGEVTGIAPWVDPEAGACPASHPVKAKLASGIFHVPGGASYERTRADRCYVDTATAETDGMRAAKR